MIRFELSPVRLSHTGSTSPPRTFCDLNLDFQSALPPFLWQPFILLHRHRCVKGSLHQLARSSDRRSYLRCRKLSTASHATSTAQLSSRITYLNGLETRVQGVPSTFLPAGDPRPRPLRTAFLYQSDDERIHLAGILSVQPFACAV